MAEGTPRELKHQVAGDAVVISLRDASAATAAAAACCGDEPYVREITAEGDQLRLYVDDGGHRAARSSSACSTAAASGCGR